MIILRTHGQFQATSFVCLRLLQLHPSRFIHPALHLIWQNTFRRICIRGSRKSDMCKKYLLSSPAAVAQLSSSHRGMENQPSMRIIILNSLVALPCFNETPMKLSQLCNQMWGKCNPTVFYYSSFPVEGNKMGKERNSKRWKRFLRLKFSVEVWDKFH